MNGVQLRLIAWLAALGAACGGGAASGPDSHGEPGRHGEHGEHGRHGEHGEHGEHSGPIGHRFERAEEWAPRFDSETRDSWQHPDQVIEAMAIEPGMTVADIGAGTGYFLPHLSRAVGERGRVLGLDIEPDMVRYMTERAEREGLANVEARVVPHDDPELPAGGVDRVLLVNTWHHIPDREAYAGKLRAGLTEGGAVYIVDFTMETEYGPPRHHRLAPDVVADELRAAGFDTRVDTRLPHQYIVIAR